MSGVRTGVVALLGQNHSVQILGFELRLITLWRRVLRRSWTSTLLRLVLLHVSLVLLAVLLAIVPASVFYLLLVWNSLR